MKKKIHQEKHAGTLTLLTHVPAGSEEYKYVLFQRYFILNTHILCFWPWDNHSFPPSHLDATVHSFPFPYFPPSCFIFSPTKTKWHKGMCCDFIWVSRVRASAWPCVILAALSDLRCLTWWWFPPSPCQISVSRSSLPLLRLSNNLSFPPYHLSFPPFPSLISSWPFSLLCHHN